MRRTHEEYDGSCNEHGDGGEEQSQRCRSISALVIMGTVSWYLCYLALSYTGMQIRFHIWTWLHVWLAY
jgi:hypothetical protein